MARYTRTAQIFHWLMFVLIIGALIVGFYMGELPRSPFKLQVVSLHKWNGVTILLLALMRVTWRVLNPPPPLPSTMPGWQQNAAHWLHRALYLLIIAMPMSGWLMSSAKGFPVVWFGVLPLPDLVEKNHDLGELLEKVHEVLAFALIGLLVLHVLAALKHHVIDRDNVLSRMLPWIKPRT